MHKLLRRQIRRCIGNDDTSTLPENWRMFVTSVNDAYVQFDEDRVLLERSLELTSRELLERNEELRRTNALELLERNKELQRSNAELEQFAYVASHDLQEPLRAITSYIQLLQRRYGTAFDETGARYLGYVVDGAKRMRALILDLLAYSRVGRGHELEDVDCNAVLADVQTSLQVVIREQGATIEVAPLPTVRANRIQLFQLFVNLVGNAIKYRGEAPSRVEVGFAKNDADEFQFFVRDNGIGIDPRHHERVFLIFQRLHERERYPGTGIGLAIVRKIVERHGGRIWLDSTVGAGATFYFTLPSRPALGSEGDAAAVGPPMPPPGVPTVS